MTSPAAPSRLGFVDTFRIYLDNRRWTIATRAKLFRSGGSQAVRLPKAYRFDGQKEVLIYRQGGKVVLEGRRGEWSRGFLALAGTAREFPYTRGRRKAEPGPDLD